MHAYKSLAVMAIDANAVPHIQITMRTGVDLASSCTAVKSFDFDSLGQVRDILGWASVAFLAAADELHEDGWEIRHTPDCTESHLADPNA